MTDLQLGLGVIGAIAVAAVLIYNRLQERGARREAERAFGAGHADVLLDERREPTLEPRGARIAAHGTHIDAEVELIGLARATLQERGSGAGADQ